MSGVSWKLGLGLGLCILKIEGRKKDEASPEEASTSSRPAID